MFPDFLEDSADVVAQRLLGCTFTRTITYAGEKHTLVARIVETEAYDESDPASHAFGGKTKRNAAMYGPAGHLYVYLSYGMHFCCNVVCSKDGYGSGVLIRAVEPISGIETMRALRESGKTRKHPLRDYDLTNGPGKVCAALSIDRTLYGHNLHKTPLVLSVNPLHAGERIIATPRIGISKNANALRRFSIEGNPFVSK